MSTIPFYGCCETVWCHSLKYPYSTISTRLYIQEWHCGSSSVDGVQCLTERCLREGAEHCTSQQNVRPWLLQTSPVAKHYNRAQGCVPEPCAGSVSPAMSHDHIQWVQSSSLWILSPSFPSFFFSYLMKLLSVAVTRKHVNTLQKSYLSLMQAVWSPKQTTFAGKSFSWEWHQRI